MNKDNIKYLMIVPILLSTACAPPRPVMEPNIPSAEVQSVPAAKLQAQNITTWEIRGAMAAKNKSKGWSATMHWAQHGPNSYRIRLMGPLGAGTVLINKEGSVVSYQDGPKKISATDADELLLQQTGIRLPVANLYYWVRGLAAPGKAGASQYDQAHHLIQLRQSGYTINFNNYKNVKGADLPGAIRLDGNGVMVKVVIKSWAI